MPWTKTTIETRRLRLRVFRDDDKATIISLVTDPAVRRHLGGPVPSEHVDGIRHATVGERWGAFCVADLTTDTAIGSVSFGQQHGELEVSYDLLPEYWHRGLATEAVAAAIGWAWSHTDDPSIIAVTQTANERSLRLLDRLGFVAEREFEEFGAPQSQLRLARPSPDPI